MEVPPETCKTVFRYNKLCNVALLDISTYLSGLVTAVAVFWNPNTIPFCLATDLLLNDCWKYIGKFCLSTSRRTAALSLLSLRRHTIVLHVNFECIVLSTHSQTDGLFVVFPFPGQPDHRHITHCHFFLWGIMNDSIF